jgi:hypothetical protein
VPPILRIVAAVAFALPLYASYASRELVIPIVGRIVEPSHAFKTMLWITNVSDTTAHVSLEFLPTGGATAARGSSATLTLAPQATHSTGALGADVIPTSPGLGALRLRADQMIVATARIAAGMPNDPPSSSATFTAIPAELAIRSGEATLLHGASFARPPLQHDKLYIVETNNDALQCTISVVADDGSTLAQNAVLLHPHEHQSLDLQSWFPTVVAPHATLRIRAMNGGGAAIVGMSSTIDTTGDVAAMEMTIAPPRKRGIPSGEVIAYVVAALAIVVAARRSA